MRTPSPTLEGLGAILRRPACGLAEIVWRWSFGVAAGVLLISAGAAYLNTLTVSPAQLLLLKSRQPVFVLQALAAIFRGSAGRAFAAAIVLVLALALAWIVVASLGRASSLKSIVEYFQLRGMAFPASPSILPMLRSLFGLHFLRVTVTLAATVASLGALIISTASESRETAALALWLLLMLVWLTWSSLNWLLSLAAIFVAARAKDVLGSIAAAVDLYRTRRWAFFAVGAWFNFAHLLAFASVSFAVIAPFLLARRFSLLPMLAAVVSIIAYCAIMDFLYVARLAAYLSMILSPQPPPIPVAPQLDPQAGDDARVDPDELILGDLPLLPS
jgi:hypothetical protein